ncbi:MAG: aminotransferase class III-fold pyridoxal phosphate-dependent enzyme [Pirellulaceae bacterium]|nr:aminotransferase class III-fold pyridoxal phosphate-dependent enzyme [Pirellulaceae bacterium]
MSSERLERLLKRTFLDYQQTMEFLRAPLVIDRAEGLYYWDVAGRRYFDAIGGIFVAVLGHRHPRVVAAMQRQLERVTFAPPLHGIADVTLEFVEKLGAVAPGNLHFVKAFSGGSESTEAAMKFARQYFKQTGQPGKYKFVSCYAGYHGGTFGAMAASGTGRRKTKFEPQAAGFLKTFLPLHYRDRFATWEEANRFAAQAFEDLIVAEDPATVAGVMLEPISNTAGIVTPTDDFFRLLREICDRHQVLLIFDEIITGFARTGQMFAAQTFGVTPDMICAGKALSSGLIPLGSMIAREDMADAFWGSLEADVQFAHGHTYAGNPLACAVGSAVLDEILEHDLCGKARALGDYLAQRLESLRALGVVREVRGKGVLRGVELVEDPVTNRPFPPDRKLGTFLKRTALANGLILRIDPDWFAVCPALIAERSDLDEMVELIERSLRDALDLMAHAA